MINLNLINERGKKIKNEHKNQALSAHLNGHKY